MKAELVGGVAVLWMLLWLFLGAWLAKRFPGRKDVVVMLYLPVFMTVTVLFAAVAIPWLLSFAE